MLVAIILLTLWGMYWFAQAVKWRTKWEREVPPVKKVKPSAT